MWSVTAFKFTFLKKEQLLFSLCDYVPFLDPTKWVGDFKIQGMPCIGEKEKKGKERDHGNR